MSILTRIFSATKVQGRDVSAALKNGWAPTHRHRKGGLYRRVTTAVLEADRSDVVIYDDADGTIWVRPVAEFEDGRFTPL